MQRLRFYIPFVVAVALLVPGVEAGQLVAASRLLEIAPPRPPELLGGHEEYVHYFYGEPAVVNLGLAGFAVAWEEYNDALFPDDYRSSIVGVRVDGQGRPAEKFQANTVHFDGGQWSPALAHLGNGRFVASFTAGDVFGTGLFFRRFESALALDAESVWVDGLPDFRFDYDPVMAANSEGRFVIAWGQSWHNPPPLANPPPSPAFQIFEASGNPVTSVVEVCSLTVNDEWRLPAVGMDALGNVTMVWQGSCPASGPAGTWMQRFDRAGRALGEPRRLGNLAASNVVIVEDPWGGFVASWFTTAQPGKKRQLLLRRFKANGEAVGPAVEVYRQLVLGPPGFYPYPDPALAQDRRGNTAVLWRDGKRAALAAFDYGLKRQGPVVFDSPLGNIPIWNPDRAGVAFGDDGRILTVWLGPKKPGAQDSVLGRFWQVR